MSRKTISKDQSAAQAVNDINSNFEELYNNQGGGGGGEAVTAGVVTENTGDDIRDGGEYLECEYNVWDISSATGLFNSSTSINTAFGMIVDGEQKTFATTYQFDKIGLHTVKVKLNGTTLGSGTFNNLGTKMLYGVRLPSNLTTIEANAFGANSPRYIAFGPNVSSMSDTGNPWARDIILTSETPPANVFIIPDWVDNNNIPHYSCAVAHVKPSALAAYLADENWGEWADRITDAPLECSKGLYEAESGHRVQPNPLAGKVFAFIGDSFTEGEKWPYYFGHIVGAKKIMNFATSGDKWSTNTRRQANDLIARVKGGYIGTTPITAQNPAPDYIYIFLGVNDVNEVGNGEVIGDITYKRGVIGNGGLIADYDTKLATYNSTHAAADHPTFSEGIQATLAVLQAAFPDAVIKVGWTPNGTQFNMTGDISAWIDRLKELAILYSVEYVEVRSCGISTLAADVKYFDAGAQAAIEAGTSIGGGHPSDAGQRRIAEAMARIMQCHL